MPGLNIIGDKLDALEILAPNLRAKDRTFAADLIAKGRKYKMLSDKQLYWVDLLANRAMGLDENGNKPEVKTAEVGNFEKVIALFKKAKESLKWPKVVMNTGPDTNLTVALSMAGANSKAPGTINVTDGKPFGQNVWYGRVNVDGTMTQGKAPADDMGVVVEHLKKFGEDPHGVAQAYGGMTGCCTFCNRKLKDPKSVTVGYGPVCADKWGLKDQWNKALKEAE